MEPVQATPTERTIRYARDVQAELKKVVWPTQQQMIAFTAVVLGSVAVTAGVLLFFDWLFHLGVQFLVP